MHICLGFIVCTLGYLISIRTNGSKFFQYHLNLNLIDKKMYQITRNRVNYLEMNNRFQCTLLVFGVAMLLLATINDYIIFRE